MINTDQTNAEQNFIIPMCDKHAKIHALIRTHILRGARRNRSHGYETPGIVNTTFKLYELSEEAGELYKIKKRTRTFY